MNVLLGIVKEVCLYRPRTLALGVVLAIVHALSVSALPWLVYRGLQSGARKEQAFWEALALLAVCALSHAASRYCHVRIAKSWTRNVRSEVGQSYLSLSPGAFDALNYFGVHMNVLTATEILDRFLTLLLSQVLPASLLACGLLVMIGLISPACLVTILGFGAAFAAVHSQIRRRLSLAMRENQDTWKQWCAGFWRIGSLHTLFHVRGDVDREIVAQNKQLDVLESSSRRLLLRQGEYRGVQEVSFLALCAALVIFFAGPSSPPLLIALFLLRSQAQSLSEAIPLAYEACDAANVLQGLRHPEDPHASHGSLRPADWNGGVRLQDVSFRYPGRPLGLTALSFELRPGEVVLLKGPNGIGKSTLLKLLLGFIRPSSGQIMFGDYDISHLDLQHLRRSLGILLQDFSLSDGQSGGEKRWEAIEMLLPPGRTLYLLDEPTNHLDATHCQRLREHILACAAQPAAVLIVSHDERLLSVATRVVSLSFQDSKETGHDPIRFEEERLSDEDPVAMAQPDSEPPAAYDLGKRGSGEQVLVNSYPKV